MPEGCIWSQNCVTGRTGSGFEIRTRFDHNRFGAKPSAKSHGNFTHTIGFVFGTRSQSVIYMHRSDITACGDGKDQERHRIGTTGNATYQRRSRRRERATGKEPGMTFSE